MKGGNVEVSSVTPVAKVASMRPPFMKGGNTYYFDVRTQNPVALQ